MLRCAAAFEADPTLAQLSLHGLHYRSDGELEAELRARKDPAAPGFAFAPVPFLPSELIEAKDGMRMQLRPIRGEDEPALRHFFETLSKESVFFRFGQQRINMPHDHLARFCQVDYDRDLAFLAFVGGKEETIIGDVRLNSFADLESAELSFIVADAWQGQGVGSMLMDFSIGVAKEIGLKTLLMEITKSNTRMIRFGYKYDFGRLPGNKDDDMEELQLEIGESH